MKALSCSLTLWIVLAAASWLLAGDHGFGTAQLLAMWGLFALPPLAVWLTARAAAALPGNRFWRVAFWAVTGGGWLAAFIFAQGRYESHSAEQGQNLLLSFCLLGAAAVWVGINVRSLPKLRVFCEAAAGLVVLALVGGMLIWIYDAGSRSIAAQAEARWTEIGRPMAEFEKNLAPGPENAGSEVFRQVLRDKIGTRFYKDGTAAAAREPAVEQSKASDELMTRAMSILGAKVPPSDDFELAPQSVSNRIKRTSSARNESPRTDPPAQPLTADEPMTPALDADFRRILATEAPSWASDPHDGFEISVPNFLGVRKFAQLSAAHALRRLSVGDQEGAASAIAAGLRAGESLRQNPTLVSLMIHVAVEGLLAPQQVRLPAAEDGLPKIARDAAALRAEFLKRVQLESWAGLRFADRTNEGEVFPSFSSTALPRWARRVAHRHLARRQLALGALEGAEHAAIHQSPATLTLPDLGQSLHDAVAAKHSNYAMPNFNRAAMRIEATLLLREQAELIRDARARLATGRAVESRDSVVFPGVRWELIADAEKNTVATRLTGAPEWIKTNAVTTNDFWLLPLDGSVAWQFRPRAQTASRL